MGEKLIGSHKVTMSFAALAACAAMLYARALGYEYVWDDLIYLSEFDYYRGVDGAVRAVAEPFFLYPDYYRPLVMLSFVVSAESWVQHAINVALHALNTVQVFFCARALMPQEAREGKAGLMAAALGALVFAVHPVAVEPVAWVSGRFDTLMCTCVLGTSLAALGGRLTRRRLAVVFVLFFAAMCSKESAVGLPVALPFLLLLKWRLAGEKVERREVVRQLAPVLAVLALAVALYIAARLVVVQALFADRVTFSAGGVLDKLNIAALAVTAFAKLVVNPWSHSAPLHPLGYEAGSGILPQTLLVAVCVLALLAAVFLKKPRLNFPLALLAALAMSWPALHLIGIPSGENLISDRYALAPLALLAAGLAATAGAWQARRAPAMAAAGERRALAYVGVFALLWAGALAAHTNATIPMWRNEYVLWAFAHTQAPESELAAKSHIKTLMMQEKWDEANSQFNQFFNGHQGNLARLDIEGATNWMVTRAKTGDYQGAMELFEVAEKILAITADKGGEYVRNAGILYRSRGIIDSDIGDWQQALHWHEKSVQISPADVRSAFRYAQALFMAGQTEKSEEVFSRALAGASKDLAAWAVEWRKGWQLPAQVAAPGASAP